MFRRASTNKSEGVKAPGNFGIGKIVVTVYRRNSSATSFVLMECNFEGQLGGTGE